MRGPPSKWGIDVVGQLIKLGQAIAYGGAHPIETLRWAHHRCQRAEVGGFEKRLEELFPRIFDLPLTATRLSELPAEASYVDLIYLCLMAKYINAQNLLEIGTLYGRTTVNLAYNTPPKARIITADLGNDEPGIGKRREEVGVKFRGLPVAHKITQLLVDSTNLDLSCYEPFGFIFIDGNHEYQAVKQDTLKCLDALRRGGILAWHDYGLSEEVTHWLDELRVEQGLEIWSLQNSVLAVYLKR